MTSGIHIGDGLMRNARVFYGKSKLVKLLIKDVEAAVTRFQSQTEEEREKAMMDFMTVKIEDKGDQLAKLKEALNAFKPQKPKESNEKPKPSQDK